jgi:hypothetical protein
MQKSHQAHVVADAFLRRAGPPPVSFPLPQAKAPKQIPPHASAADDDHRRGRLPPLRRIRHARRPRQGPGGLLQGTSLISPVPALLRRLPQALCSPPAFRY